MRNLFDGEVSNEIHALDEDLGVSMKFLKIATNIVAVNRGDYPFCDLL